ncbi:ANTAR domain-containing protein [Streptomyces massasporeus]
MTTFQMSRRDSATAPTCELATELERIRAQNRQLQQAVVPHAVVDQAIGALVVLGQITPNGGLAVLREVSQHTTIKVFAIAEQILKFAQGAPLPDVLLEVLRAVLARHTVDSQPVWRHKSEDAS